MSEYRPAGVMQGWNVVEGIMPESKTYARNECKRAGGRPEMNSVQSRYNAKKSCRRTGHKQMQE
jgi:hypothetical protein